jgi:hypothetical protein
MAYTITKNKERGIKNSNLQALEFSMEKRNLK